MTEMGLYKEKSCYIFKKNLQEFEDLQLKDMWKNLQSKIKTTLNDFLNFWKTNCSSV